MLSQKNKIDAQYLKDKCAAEWLEINVFDQIDSTNSWLKKNKKSPTVCLAETQTQGRGRNGNQWFSPDSQNIYLSLNWVFESQPKHLQWLSLWIGIVIAETLASFGIQGHGIKWPNDLYFNNKKLGGILIETSSATSEMVVGIGINGNVSVMDDIDQPWTSLSEIRGKDIDRNELLVQLLDALFVAMGAFPELSLDELLARWAKWDLVQGKSITFLHGGASCEGVAQGIDYRGHLLVRLRTGEIKAFSTSITKVRW